MTTENRKQPDSTSNSNPDPNHNCTTKQQAAVGIQLSIVTCPTYPEKFTRDYAIAPFFYFQVSLSLSRRNRRLNRVACSVLYFFLLMFGLLCCINYKFSFYIGCTLPETNRMMMILMIWLFTYLSCSYNLLLIASVY